MCTICLGSTATNALANEPSITELQNQLSTLETEVAALEREYEYLRSLPALDEDDEEDEGGDEDEETGDETDLIQEARIAFITDLYRCILKRDPHPRNLENWLARIDSTKQLTLYRSFFLGREYKALDTSDEEYVSTLYTCILNRGAGQLGLDHWLTELQTESRKFVVDHFVASKEYREGRGADIADEAEIGLW